MRPDNGAGQNIKIGIDRATKKSCSREINQVYKTPGVDTTPFIDPIARPESK
jgi:hypothetical protein